MSSRAEALKSQAHRMLGRGSIVLMELGVALAGLPLKRV